MDGKKNSEISSDDADQIQQMMPSDDTVLYRLYEVSNTLKADIKPHPYQSFDMASVVRKVYSLEQIPGTVSSFVKNDLNDEKAENEFLVNEEFRGPEVTCGVALHKLYQVPESPVEKQNLKAHPYQYFDKSTVSKQGNSLETVFNFGQVEVRRDETSAVKASDIELFLKPKLSVLKCDQTEVDGDRASDIEPVLKIALTEVSEHQDSVLLTKNVEKAQNIEITKRLLDKLNVDSKEKRENEKTDSAKNDAESDLIQLRKEFKSEKIVIPNLLRVRGSKKKLKKVKCLFCHMSLDLGMGNARKAIEAHISTGNHKDQKRYAIRDQSLAALPKLGLVEAHKLRLEDLINEVTELATSSLSEEIGLSLLDVYQAFLKSKTSGQTLILVGSHAYELPMQNSDVNFMVKVDRTRSIFFQMNELKELFSNCSFVESVKLECTGILRISSRYLSRKVTITVFDEAHEKMALVLKQYIHHLRDNLPLAWKIVVAFRYWANATGLDRKEDGLIPGYVFTIIAICILQHLRVVPVIAEKTYETDLLNWKPNKKFLNVGCLWYTFWITIKTFPFWSSVVSVNHSILPKRSERSWGSKHLAVECPGDPKLNLCRKVPCKVGYSELVNAFKNAICYFCVPQLKHGPLFQALRMNDIPPQPERRHPSEEKDDTFSENKEIHETDKRENYELLSEQKHIDEEIRQSISVDEDLNGSTLGRSDDLEGIVQSEEEEDVVVEATKIDDVDVSRDIKKEKYVHFHTDRFDKLVIRNKSDCSVETSDSDSGDDNKIDVTKINMNDIPSMSIPEARQAAKALSKSDLFYSFNHSALLDNRTPLKVCTICGSLKHGAGDCPLVRLPRVLPLPKMTPEHQSKLEDVLCTKCEILMPNTDDIMKRREAITAIQRYIQIRFSKAIIQPFGSCNNGFGFANSDLDLCFMLMDNPTGEGIDAVKIVYQLANHLQRNPDFSDVFPIVTAKVPIVKGFYVPGNLEMDISVYNVLAVHNTRLLYTYAYIDTRIQYLGYLTKALAKVCDIGDASKGSLSSYAFIQMVLYYAQRCNPPLIPNLQEMYEGTTQPQRITEGWNTWFYEPTSAKPLKTLWQYFGMNRDPLAVHWVNFLSFYAEKFDWSNYVVSIRSLEPIAKMDKGWTGKEMCIEDPFNWSHNLSGALTVKMVTFIKTVFIEAREHFGIQQHSLPASCSSWMNYYWSASYMLKRCKPPRDRPSCFICGSLHHRRLDCPKKQENRTGIITQPDKQKKNNFTGRQLRKNFKVDKASANENNEVRIVRNSLSSKNAEIGGRTSQSSPVRNISSQDSSSEVKRRDKEYFQERKSLYKTNMAKESIPNAAAARKMEKGRQDSGLAGKVSVMHKTNVAKDSITNAKVARKVEKSQQDFGSLERSQKYREPITEGYRQPNVSTNTKIKPQSSPNFRVRIVKNHHREPEMPENLRMKSMPHSLSEGNSVSNGSQKNGNILIQEGKPDRESKRRKAGRS